MRLEVRIRVGLVRLEIRIRVVLVRLELSRIGLGVRVILGLRL